MQKIVHQGQEYEVLLCGSERTADMLFPVIWRFVSHKVAIVMRPLVTCSDVYPPVGDLVTLPFDPLKDEDRSQKKVVAVECGEEVVEQDDYTSLYIGLMCYSQKKDRIGDAVESLRWEARLDGQRFFFRDVLTATLTPEEKEVVAQEMLRRSDGSDKVFFASENYTTIRWKGEIFRLHKSSIIVEALDRARKVEGLDRLHKRELCSEFYSKGKAPERFRVQDYFRTGDAKKLWDAGFIRHDGRGSFWLTAHTQ